MSRSIAQPEVAAEASVHHRYSAAAQAVDPMLCCPVTYRDDLLAVIPEEVIERDYGCGDPTPYVRSGETVLDLGSGGGKLCFIAAQVVGRSGRVIGVDCNREMLGLARRAAPTVAARLGFANVDFRYGMIQDLRLDLQQLEQRLEHAPVQTSEDYLRLRAIEDELREASPLVESDSVDCILSNCVLNLVRNEDRRRLFAEAFRVLREGGRAAISDIVSDESVPEELRRDPQLWSGCLSGAFREDEFLQAFEAAGFQGIEVVKREAEPWQTVRGIEFRSVTVVAYKGPQGPCLERNQAVIYRGPFRSVNDDDGHTYRRGERTAVCDRAFRQLTQEPYARHFDPVAPLVAIPLSEAEPYDCRRTAPRHPAETKGIDYQTTIGPDSASCGPASGCC